MHLTNLLVLLPMTLLPAAVTANNNNNNAIPFRRQVANSTHTPSVMTITTTSIATIVSCPTEVVDCPARETTLTFALTSTLSAAPLFPLPNSTFVAGTGTAVRTVVRGTAVGTVGIISSETGTSKGPSGPLATGTERLADGSNGSPADVSDVEGSAVRVGMGGALGLVLGGLVITFV